MKHWALVVVGLYVLILAVLAGPMLLIAFAPEAHAKDITAPYLSLPFWLWLAVMALSQAAMLVVPVRVANRRPMSQRSLLWPVATAGLMMGALAVGAILSLIEFAIRGESDWFSFWTAIVCGVVIWCVWTVLFCRSSRDAEPADVVSRQCRLMLRGSILELLIAVPTHIIARSRGYCCAGVMTFIGLALGISVMLFSFGPSVFFLYAARWRRLHPTPATEPGQPV